MDVETIDNLGIIQSKNQLSLIAGLISVPGRQMPDKFSIPGVNGHDAADRITVRFDATQLNCQKPPGSNGLIRHQSGRGVQMRDRKVLATITIPVESR